MDLSAVLCRTRRIRALASAVALVAVLGSFAGGAAPAYAVAPAPAAGGFEGINPFRLLDTRSPTTPTGAPTGGCLTGERPLQVVGVPGSAVPADAGAVALNVTAVTPGNAGFITVWPSGVSRPTASSLNYRAGDIVPNNVIVKVGAFGSVMLFANAGCPHLVVDVVGWFAGGQAVPGGLSGITPERALDTRRPGQGPCIGAGGSQTRDVRVAGGAFSAVPANAAAVALNVTVVSPGNSGYLTVYPKGNPRPTASTLNYTSGQIVPNGTVVKVGNDGQITLYALSGCPDVVVDLVGWFAPGSPTSAGGFFGVNPFRLLDSREGAQQACNGGSRTFHIPAAGVAGTAVPSESRAVALNVTVTNPGAAGFVTVFPTGSPRPNASNLNYTTGQTVPNGVLIKLGAQQSIDVFANFGCPDVIVDVVGGFASQAVPLVDGCTMSAALQTPCNFVMRTSIAPESAEIGAVTGPQALSNAGRYVAFTAGTPAQVFRRDTLTGTTVLVSHGSAPLNLPGDDNSSAPVISADGRYVAFLSDASNLDPLDRVKSTFYTEAYRWDATTDSLDRFEYDTARVGSEEPDDDATTLSMSASGNRIAIVSAATNLTPVANPSLQGEALVFTFSSRTWINASKVPLEVFSPFGVEGVNLSADGRFVAFATADPIFPTYDTNDVLDVYRYDLADTSTDWVTRRPTGGSTVQGGYSPTLSSDGRWVAFTSLSTEYDTLPGDTEPSGNTPGTEDVFLRDMNTTNVSRVSKTETGQTLNGNSTAPVMSGDARWIAYLTTATNAALWDDNTSPHLVNADVLLGRNTIASRDAAGKPIQTPISDPAMAPDGSVVGFTTTARATADDNNALADTFIASRGAVPLVASVGPTTLSSGTTTTVTVTGLGFAPDAVPVVGGEGVSVSGVTVNPIGTVVTFTITTIGASGVHDLWIRNPGGAGRPYAGAVSLGLTGALRVPA